MKISILIPCYNEALTIEKCVNSCLNQKRRPDEIVVVNDSSTDDTAKILKKFGKEIKVVKTPRNTGNKSHAQEYGLKFITGDIFITTDGDTILQEDFISIIKKDMTDESISAVAGYVKSLKYNWLTACRALDYIISGNIDKLAQHYMNFIFVIPGAAGAFRTKVFREKIFFTHDTITEDLDFTYRLHKLGYKIGYNRKAVCYTQDPTTLHAYINQMRRWFGGGWQNFLKHFSIPEKPGMALELSLMYVEGLSLSFLAFVMPLINLYMAINLFLMYCAVAFLFCVFGAIKDNRMDLLFILPFYIFLKYVNAYIFIEQFFKEIIFRKKNLSWFKPERVNI
jgi:cellulose synthase/poly-beta-1,6-N-acetylglucosamine synthase-like glycosyltransferase